MYESPKTLSEFSRIKDWMRTPQCRSAGDKFGQGWESIDLMETCCGDPFISAENVDVYYWPEPGADTSCLSIIGDNVNPLTQGATTDSTGTYWACTAQNPTTDILEASYVGSTYIWISAMTVRSIITTAQMASVGPITFKQSLYNPWSPPACLSMASSSPKPAASVGAQGLHASIHARGHSLVLPASVTQENGLPVSTVVSGQFTL